jgi:hypothetical protein
LTVAVGVVGEALYRAQIVVVIPRSIGVVNAVLIEEVSVVIERERAVRADVNPSSDATSLHNLNWNWYQWSSARVKIGSNRYIIVRVRRNSE